MSGFDKSGFIKLEGFKELQDLLLQLPEEVGPEKLLKKSCYNAARVVREEAASRAPEGKELHDFDKFPQRLKQSIRREMGRPEFEGLNAKYSVVCLVGVTAWAFYARMVEFGTRFQQPQPFLGPAFDATKEEFISELGDELGAQLDKVWTSSYQGRRSNA